MGSDVGLDEIRKKKLLELQNQFNQEKQISEREKVLENQKNSLLRQILTVEARQRLNRIKLIKPKFVEQLEIQLIQIAQSGRVQIPITDIQLKQILKSLQQNKREIRFRRV